MSALAVVLLESVKRTTLEAFLNPSGNVSQTIRTEHLGRLYPSWQGHAWVLILMGDLGSVILHTPSSRLFQTSELTQSKPIIGMTSPIY